MADRLTQLQDCLDDLLTQMYASLNYVQTKHTHAVIEGQTSQGAQSERPQGIATNTSGTAAANAQAAGEAPAPASNDDGGQAGTSRPDPPEVFHRALREMAQDLVIKEQQIEYLINSLPGLGNSESSQESRMRELEAELRQVEAAREIKEAEREAMIDLLGSVIVKVKRVP